MKENCKVVIVVEDGLVQNVYSNYDVDVEIIDFD